MKLTKNQIMAIEKCNNDYLKALYITDFLFNKEKTKDGFHAILRETNKISNVNVKKFYLYLICKFNLRHKLSFLEDTIGCIPLNKSEEDEVVNLEFIDVCHYKDKNYSEKLNNNALKAHKLIRKMRRN